MPAHPQSHHHPSPWTLERRERRLISKVVHSKYSVKGKSPHYSGCSFDHPDTDLELAGLGLRQLWNSLPHLSLIPRLSAIVTVSIPCVLCMLSMESGNEASQFPCSY